MYKFIILLFSFSVFSQNQISGKISLVDTQSDYKFLTVLLKQNDSIITGSEVNEVGLYKFVKKIPNGNYNLTIQQLGYRDIIIENINVNDKDLLIDFNYPAKCEYKKDKPRKCINNHKDNIIPIAYGLPTKRLMKKAKKR